MAAKITLTLVAALLAAPALAEPSIPPSVDGNREFRAYENGAPAGVRAVTFREVDTDRNGRWDTAEIARVFGADTVRDVFMTFDANGDFWVTPFEIRAYDDNGTGGPDGILKERVRG